MTMIINSDCMYYKGEKPCKFARLCDGCPEYKPWKGQILIIKTAAMGDVLRTTSILPALERKYPGFKVTWLTGAASAPLLKNNPLIHDVLIIGSGIEIALQQREFDIVISLDKTVAEIGLASSLKANNKFGIGMSKSGPPVPLNEEAEYYFSLGLSDDLKFKKNKKTYHALTREVCALDDRREPPSIHLKDHEKKKAREILDQAGCDPRKREKIGIVPGAGKVFAHKSPSTDWWAKFVKLVKQSSPETEIVILGGPEDIEEINKLRKLVGDLPCIAQNDVRLYAGVVSMMEVVVTGDTMALHIATAFAKPIVALFGPTCAAEIDLFVKGEKLLSPLSCAPCYCSNCDKNPSCTDSIDPARAVKWAVSFL